MAYKHQKLISTVLVAGSPRMGCQHSGVSASLGCRLLPVPYPSRRGEGARWNLFHEVLVQLMRAPPSQLRHSKGLSWIQTQWEWGFQHLNSGEHTLLRHSRATPVGHPCSLAAAMRLFSLSLGFWWSGGLLHTSLLTLSRCPEHKLHGHVLHGSRVLWVTQSWVPFISVHPCRCAWQGLCNTSSFVHIANQPSKSEGDWSYLYSQRVRPWPCLVLCVSR